MMRVKICGVTSVEDALMCSELGADAIGTIVEVPVDSPRKLSRDRAREIYSALGKSVERVIVVMPRSADEAVELYEHIRPDAIQLHGSEGLDLAKDIRSSIPCRLVKTIHVINSNALEEALSFSEVCDAILLDTPSLSFGGSGKTHDWELSKAIVREVEVPVYLAGGLNPFNVRDAIKQVRPSGVDVSSGVESQPGKKDREMVKNFIENAKASSV